nr:MAG TPA: hypothetical protein [Bacteriophage sp.]
MSRKSFVLRDCCSKPSELLYINKERTRTFDLLIEKRLNCCLISYKNC